ncbi:hypothetical protein P8C59_001565 [Phyllachora maydis]|uniref:Uncharacterized protein n=1 Tax=Phyllachora maydis TaxID=1825666 RepID=A0AAD9MAD6_9PEZI|nr:hypothetical protein P8C59_001565 [Phyllachora maydis]
MLPTEPELTVQRRPLGSLSSSTHRPRESCQQVHLVRRRPICTSPPVSSGRLSRTFPRHRNKRVVAMSSRRDLPQKAAEAVAKKRPSAFPLTLLPPAFPDAPAPEDRPGKKHTGGSAGNKYAASTASTASRGLRKYQSMATIASGARSTRSSTHSGETLPPMPEASTTMLRSEHVPLPPPGAQTHQATTRLKPSQTMSSTSSTSTVRASEWYADQAQAGEGQAKAKARAYDAAPTPLRRKKSLPDVRRLDDRSGSVDGAQYARFRRDESPPPPVPRFNPEDWVGRGEVPIASRTHYCGVSHLDMGATARRGLPPRGRNVSSPIRPCVPVGYRGDDPYRGNSGNSSSSNSQARYVPSPTSPNLPLGHHGGGPYHGSNSRHLWSPTSPTSPSLPISPSFPLEYQDDGHGRVPVRQGVPAGFLLTHHAPLRSQPPARDLPPVPGLKAADPYVAAPSRTQPARVPPIHPSALPQVPPPDLGDHPALRGAAGPWAPGTLDPPVPEDSAGREAVVWPPPYDRITELTWESPPIRDRDPDESRDRADLAFKQARAHLVRISAQLVSANDVDSAYFRLPDRVRFRVMTFVLGPDGGGTVKPVRLNKMTYLSAVWPRDAFDSLEHVLRQHARVLRASFGFHLDAMATLLTTRRFHVVCTPFTTRTLQPASGAWLERFGRLMQYVTLETDLTVLHPHPRQARVHGAEADVVGLALGLTGPVRDQVARFVDVVQQGRFEPMENFQLMVRRYWDGPEPEPAMARMRLTWVLGPLFRAPSGLAMSMAVVGAGFDYTADMLRYFALDFVKYTKAKKNKEKDGKEKDGKEKDGKEKDGKEKDGKEKDGKDGDDKDGDDKDGDDKDGEDPDGKKKVDKKKDEEDRGRSFLNRPSMLWPAMAGQRAASEFQDNGIRVVEYGTDLRGSRVLGPDEYKYGCARERVVSVASSAQTEQSAVSQDTGSTPTASSASASWLEVA